MINKSEAIALAHKYHAQQFLPANQVTDTFPTGTCYWTLKGGQEDYWYVPVPEMAQRAPQTGGKAFYFAVSKWPGEVSVLVFGGE